MLADISLFESFCRPSGSQSYICNSESAVVLQSYDQTKKSVALCQKFIEEMQAEEYIPADLISQMYQAKEQYSASLVSLKQELMEKAAQEPLDAFDREVFMTLSEEAQADLQSVLKADEVFRRALEMKDEAAAVSKTEPEGEVAAETKESDAKPKQKAAPYEAVPEEAATEEVDLGDVDLEADLAADVSSEENT